MITQLTCPLVNTTTMLAITGFLTAMRQEVTRAHKGWALDVVTLHNDITKYSLEEIKGPPPVRRKNIAAFYLSLYFVYFSENIVR